MIRTISIGAAALLVLGSTSAIAQERSLVTSGSHVGASRPLVNVLR